jgi:hypothetical protein
MTHGKHKKLGNHPRSSLPTEEYERLLPDLNPVSLRQNDVLSEAATPINYGHFVSSGLVTTMVVMRDTKSVDVGMLGSEGRG